MNNDHLRVAFAALFDADKRKQVKVDNITIKQAQAFAKRLSRD